MSRFPHGISATTNDASTTGEVRTNTLSVEASATIETLVVSSACTLASATVNHMAVSSGMTVDHFHCSSGATFDDDLVMSAGQLKTFAKKLDAATKTVTITSTSPNVLVCGPGSSASTVQLPDDSVSAGLFFLIRHSGTNSKTLAIKDSGSTALCTISSAQAALAFCSSKGWFAHQMAAS